MKRIREVSPPRRWAPDPVISEVVTSVNGLLKRGTVVISPYL